MNYKLLVSVDSGRQGLAEIAFQAHEFQPQKPWDFLRSSVGDEFYSLSSTCSFARLSFDHLAHDFPRTQFVFGKHKQSRPCRVSFHAASDSILMQRGD
jgi:hypothetical protein